MPGTDLLDQKTETKTEETKTQETETKQTETKEGEKTLLGDEKKAEETKTEETKAEGAPEKYEDFKIPDGFELNQDLLGEFHALAKELDLPQDAAQKLVDMSVKIEEAGQTKLQEIVSQMDKEWTDEIKADKEFGGNNFNETHVRAKQVLKMYGSDRLTNDLNQSRMGNHPDLIKLFARVAKALGEDHFVEGKGPSKEPKSAAERLFPNQGKQ